MPSSPEIHVKVGKCGSTGQEISICYNTFGDSNSPCVLLVMGLNGVGPMWRDNFCEMIADAGFYVIRYDNRDVGLSTLLSDSPTPGLFRFILPKALSFGEKIPYTLEDMAADGMNLLTALGIKEAHVVGMSMGGMIVQIMAIRYPDRVRSLNIIFSHTSSPKRVPESWSAKLWFLNKPASSELEDMLEFKYQLMCHLAGPTYRMDKEECKQFTKRMLERAPENPMGMRRQLAAIMRAPSREAQLRGLKIPTLVLHGMLDQLIPYQNGVQIAELIGGAAKLVLYPRMGHTLPVELIPSLAEEIIWNARRASVPA